MVDTFLDMALILSYPFFLGHTVCNFRAYLSLMGHWTGVTSSPTYFKKGWDFYIIGSFDMCNDCMLSFTFQIDLFLKKYEHF